MHRVACPRALPAETATMKALFWSLCAVALLVLAYVAAGPVLTLRTIEQAAADNRTIAIARRVDFPALRASLKRQLADEMIRRAGAERQASMAGQLGLRAGALAIDTAVEASVNPAGLAAVMQGRKAWDWWRTPALTDAPAGEVPPTSAPPPTHVQSRMRYESLSRFTVTRTDAQGRTTVLVLTRRGLRWRLSDIRLPLGPAAAPALDAPARS